MKSFKKLTLLLLLLPLLPAQKIMAAENTQGSLFINTAKNVYFYDVPNAKAVSNITRNQKLGIISINDGWALVNYNERLGYVNFADIVMEASLANIQSAQESSNSSETSSSQTKYENIQKGYYNPSVKLTPWSEAKQVVKLHEPVEVYDVLSGRTYYVKSFSNGNHADVEPVTKNDTAIMFETFGRVWSWEVRPCWVTIGGRTMAASINGMPHAEGINNNNGMDGQICLHFLGSSTHNGNQSYTDEHQAGVLEAYRLAGL